MSDKDIARLTDSVFTGKQIQNNSNNNLYFKELNLFFDELKKDLDGVLSRAAALGVTKFICVGTNVEDSQHSYELSLKYENIFSTAGVHPHDSEEVPKDYLDQIKILLKICINLKTTMRF